MGNIWLFPWRVGKYGGAAFLVPYLFFVLVFGTVGLITEFSLGRFTRKGITGAFEFILNKKKGSSLKHLGIISIIGVSFISIGYAVVVGWVLKYLSLAMTGELLNINATNYFENFVSSQEPIAWHFLAIALTICILVAGVSKGIERVNKVIMPGFFILFFILMIRSLTLNNAMVGINYLLVPDWSYLLKPITWIMALGQAFFTASLSGTTMVVYGSYIREDQDVTVAAINTAVFDTLGALMAAFVIIPAVFSFGLDPTMGPPLLFISLPLVFQQMPFGNLFAILFFIAILFAAISSLISLVEPAIESLLNSTRWSRIKTSLFVGFIFFLIGILLDLHILNLSTWMDYASIYLLPLGAMLVALLFYWIYNPNDALKEINKGAKRPVGKTFILLAKYGYVIIAITVLILGIIYGGIG
jgi:NSS family neurotransmitter:Na+ symporter